VYAGDEQAFRGVKEDRAGGDDAVRPAFPDGPAGLALHGWGTYRLHQNLIGLRRRHRWLHQAETTVVHLANQQITYRSTDGRQALVVALNTAGTPSEQPAPGAHVVLAGEGELDRTGSPEAGVRLGPNGWAVLGT
jgi:cyclomaltodextrinase